MAKSQRAGVDGCRLLSSAEVRQLEPHITSNVKGGLWVPSERTIEPCIMPITLAHVAKQAGAKVRLAMQDLECISISYDQDLS